MNPVYADMPTTIFEEMSAAARAHGAINLGQGFPEEDGPLDVRQAAADALLHRSNQYPPSTGLPELRAAVAEHYRRLQGLDVAAEEVIVTSGATEALAASLLALVRPGDEVLLIQPMYDAYLPLVAQAGGTARFVTLRPPEWRLTAAALEQAVSPRTRLILFNNPHNPVARVFDAQEIARLADFCVAHDLIAICDEVWEHLLFDGRIHQPLIAAPGMRARTVKIGSAGKIFSLTGWKVGWTIAAPPLTTAIARAHQFLTFTTPPALQWGVAYGLAKDADHFAAMRAGYQASRDRLAAALGAAGYAVNPGESTYFLTVDLGRSGIALSDEDFCRRAVREHGVAAIPLAPFYAEDPARSTIRLCFAKSDAALDEAAARLARARDQATSSAAR